MTSVFIYKATNTKNNAHFHDAIAANSEEEALEKASNIVKACDGGQEWPMEEFPNIEIICELATEKNSLIEELQND